MKFQFKRTRIDKISRQKILEELEQAAKKFRYIEFGWRDFDKVAKISSGPVKKEFGSWREALSFLRNYLKSKNLNLLPRPIPFNRIHSDKDMFEIMEKIWIKLDHRPSRTEWESLKPKIHYSTYRKRFGGWTNACLKFIEYKMGKEILSDDELPYREVAVEKESVKTLIDKGETRTIPLSVRLQVLSRDNFRCVLCGRSPASDVGVKLHLDHKVPFSKGGKSTLDNLQTLCYECNLGKSDRKI